MTATCDTWPEVGAATVVSIFMADMTTRGCRQAGKDKEAIKHSTPYTWAQTSKNKL